MKLSNQAGAQVKKYRKPGDDCLQPVDEILQGAEGYSPHSSRLSTPLDLSTSGYCSGRTRTHRD